MEETILDHTQPCQQKSHFIRNLLDDIIKNVLGNLGKSSDETKITTCYTKEMSTIIQQFTSVDRLIPIPNGIHTPITKNLPPALMRVFQKLELKIYELNRSVNSE